MMPLLALCLGYFMTILDVTIVNVALVDIKEHLGANVTHASRDIEIRF